jgi:hypothetical protein
MGSPPLLTELNIDIYIQKYINTADRDKLQKIIEGLNRKWTDGGLDQRSEDVEIYNAASNKLKTFTAGRPKPSKKRPTARRIRSSKARKSRKARKARATRRM